MIGPEGGFSDQEITDATDAGFQLLRIGPTILRVETAAIASAAIFGAGREQLQPWGALRKCGDINSRASARSVSQNLVGTSDDLVAESEISYKLDARALKLH